MEPQWYTSIAGIAATTVVIVQALKAWLSGRATPLAKIPTAVYVIGIAALATWFARDVLHALEGALPQLLTDAVTAALIASGGFEMVRSASKQIGSAGLVVLLAIGLTASGCAARADGTQVSPEGTIALRGTAVVNTINAAAPAIESLTLPTSCGPRACLTPDEGLRVAQTIDRGLQAAEQLPPILTTVDRATEAAAREHGIAQARVILQEITRAVAEAQVLPALGEARTKIVAALMSVQIALLAVGGF